MCIRLIASKKGVNKRVFNGAKMLKQKKKNATNCLYYSFLYYLCKVF